MEITLSAQELLFLLIDKYEQQLVDGISDSAAELLIQKTNKLVEISERLAKGQSSKEDLNFTMNEAFASGMFPEADKVVHWKRH